MNNDDIIKIVNRLNDELYDQNPILISNYGIYLEFSSVGYSSIIKFLDIVIWDEDNDERDFDESKNEYEPLKFFLIRKINDILEKLGKIRL